MTFSRSAIPDFSTSNKIYAGAVVTFYTVDEGTGEKTTTKATLYAAMTGDTKLGNPQTLDSYGKFKQPVYIQQAVIGTVTGLGNTPEHDTGVISGFQYSNEAAESAAAAAASALEAESNADAAASAAADAQGMITVEVASTSINAASYYGQCIITTSNSPVQITLPDGAPAGKQVGIIQGGTGQITFLTGANPLRHRQGYYKTVGQWSGALAHAIRNTGSAEWWIDGDLTV